MSETLKIAVIGLGKIGLPLAVQFAKRGHHVIGVDINPSLVDLVNRGLEPFPGEAHLAEFLSETVASGCLTASTNYGEAVPVADAIVVVVPLFVRDDGSPDFQWIDSASESIGQHLARKTLVIYETTLPVGTTRDRLAPLLEGKSGLKEGKDFHVVFSPERVLTGRVFEDLRKYPKLVGGLSDRGEQLGVEFYEQVLEFDSRPDLPKGNGVWPLGSAETAEMVKLAETTYRDVNIGLANQFAKFADKAGLDLYAVVEAANSQPFSHIHQPGIAVGGHCIPVYPRLYLWNDPDATIVRAARAANLSMPSYAIDLLEQQLGDLHGLTVLILGAAYRGGVRETAFSGAFDVFLELRNRGAKPLVQDPLYSSAELEELGLTPYFAGTRIDAAILQANHAEYRTVSPSDFPGVRAFVDGRRWIEDGDSLGVVSIGGGFAGDGKLE